MKKFICCILIAISQSTWGEWTLCNNASQINFVTQQNEEITEVHFFNNMAGSISDQGQAIINIDLSSVETNNSLRNLQLQELFFETQRFQEAQISVNLGQSFLDSLKFDKATQITVEATLNLHGATRNINTTLLVTRLKNNCILVTTIVPIMVSLADFSFLEGLEKLRKIANLRIISNQIHVSLNLFFRINRDI